MEHRRRFMKSSHFLKHLRFWTSHIMKMHLYSDFQELGGLKKKEILVSFRCEVDKSRPLVACFLPWFPGERLRWAAHKMIWDQILDLISLPPTIGGAWPDLQLVTTEFRSKECVERVQRFYCSQSSRTIYMLWLTEFSDPKCRIQTPGKKNNLNAKKTDGAFRQKQNGTRWEQLTLLKSPEKVSSMCQTNRWLDPEYRTSVKVPEIVGWRLEWRTTGYMEHSGGRYGDEWDWSQVWLTRVGGGDSIATSFKSNSDRGKENTRKVLFTLMIQIGRWIPAIANGSDQTLKRPHKWQVCGFTVRPNRPAFSFGRLES